MSYARELNVLPSAADDADGREQVLEHWTEDEKKVLQETLCRRAEQNLSAYYSAHPQEWEAFVRIALQNRD